MAQRRCESILELLTIKLNEEGQRSRRGCHSDHLWEYIRSIQHVLLSIECYLKLKKDKRPKNFRTNIGDASYLLHAYLDDLCQPQHRKSFSRVTSSHRLCSVLDNLHSDLYREANQIRNAVKEATAGGASTVKRKKDNGGKPYTFANDHSSFSSLVRDREGETFWEKSFQGRLMVDYPNFLEALSKECGDIKDEDASRLSYVLDSSETGFISVFRFSNFLQMFKPLKDCVQKANREMQAKYFQGFMSMEEVSRLLSGRPRGTFITRISKTQPESVIISHIDHDHNVQNIHLEGNPHGYHMANASSIGNFPDIQEFIEVHKIYKEGLYTDLTRSRYFLGHLAEEEAREILKREKKGSYIVWYNSDGLTVSYNNESEGITHHKGLTLKNDGYIWKQKKVEGQKVYQSLEDALSGLQDRLLSPLRYSTFDVPKQDGAGTSPKVDGRGGEKPSTRPKVSSLCVSNLRSLNCTVPQTIKDNITRGEVAYLKQMLAKMKSRADLSEKRMTSINETLTERLTDAEENLNKVQAQNDALMKRVAKLESHIRRLTKAKPERSFVPASPCVSSPLTTWL
ncbi:hypothetical protein PROFUN_05150 [Planoprotostelium fungivorum]|uniref:Uncharacterized protein n=1 Tax=Planoprotostelium fungivorum TaxID=1890364 RepID=A0A2P6NRU7_9EUKA|nr:hypothetical protein PROFUN_05150 [Planoprotostelium fungivorum]